MEISSHSVNGTCVRTESTLMYVKMRAQGHAYITAAAARKLKQDEVIFCFRSGTKTL